MAPFSLTALTLKTLLNFSNNDNNKKWNNSLDIINLFSLAGYQTHTFSNQEVSWKLPAFSSMAFFADYQTHLSKFITESGEIIDKSNGYDENLLPFIQSALKQNQAEFNLDIIHLAGQHLAYEHRYPKEFEKFNAQDIHYPSYIDDKQKEIIAHYNNAILYGDYVLNEIFKIYQETDAIIVYVSDHGESLYEYKGKLGHGFTSRFTAEVPLIIMMTEEFVKNHKETAQKIQAAKDKPFMSDDLIHLLCGLAQINVQDYDETKDPLSDKFNNKRIRLFYKKADYDKELKGEVAKPN
nr:phosphoethanolamine transferase [Helicobacter sp.]